MKVLMNSGWAIALFLTIFLITCQPPVEKKHLFFFHNRFLEEHNVDEKHAQYGRVEYHEILKSFKHAGFEIYSEQRKGNVNARDYAANTCKQIDSLLRAGVSSYSITVVGTSKGGYIAQYVSTIMQNPDLNFVFVACYRNTDIDEFPEIKYCGNILTIYEKSDPFGVSASARRLSSTCDIKNFKEIELDTGLKHGFLFKALDEWLKPTINWANRKFD